MERYALRYYQQHPEAAELGEAHRLNHNHHLELLGRINAALADKFRNDPLDAEHIAQQEELTAMLQGVLDYAKAE